MPVVSIIINCLNGERYLRDTLDSVFAQTFDDWEGCLSIPGMTGLVRRFLKIKVSGYDLKGDFITTEVEGLHSRVIQHEFDHLNGILFINRLAHKNAFGFENEIEKFWKKNEEKK